MLACPIFINKYHAYQMQTNKDCRVDIRFNSAWHAITCRVTQGVEMEVQMLGRILKKTFIEFEKIVVRDGGI